MCVCTCVCVHVYSCACPCVWNDSLCLVPDPHRFPSGGFMVHTHIWFLQYWRLFHCLSHCSFSFSMSISSTPTSPYWYIHVKNNIHSFSAFMPIPAYSHSVGHVFRQSPSIYCVSQWAAGPNRPARQRPASVASRLTKQGSRLHFNLHFDCIWWREASMQTIKHLLADKWKMFSLVFMQTKKWVMCTLWKARELFWKQMDEPRMQNNCVDSLV